MKSTKCQCWITTWILIMAKLGILIANSSDSGKPYSETNLLRALESNSTLAVQQILSRNEDPDLNVNFKTSDGKSPLHLASQNENLEAAKLLLTHGANVNSIQTLTDETPLHISAAQGNLEMAQLLVQNGAYVNAGIMDTPLHSAVKNNHFLIVQFLVNAGAHVNRDGTDGYSPVHLAAKGGNLGILRYLTDKGANITSESAGKRTALDLAAESGETAIVKYFAEEKRIDLNKAVDLGEITSSGFSSHNYFDSFSAGISVSRNSKYISAVLTPLMLAARNGHNGVVKLLLQNGANPNIFSDDGSALSLAAKNDHWSTVEILLKSGADVDFGSIQTNSFSAGSTSISTFHRVSPLDIAVDSGNMNNIKLLVRASDESTKQQALIRAARSSTLEMAQKILQSVDPRQINLTSILIWPAQNKKLKDGLEISRLLVRYGADLEGKDNDHNTPLLKAISYSNWDLVQFLVSSGANVNAVDKSGYTALINAATGNSFETVKSLVYKGANVNAQTKYGDSVLQRAVGSNQNASFEIVKLLISSGATTVPVKDSGFWKSPEVIATKEGRESVAIYLVRLAGEKRMLSLNLMKRITEEASQRGFTDLLQLLKRFGMNFDYTDGSNTPLSLALSSNRTSAAKFLINENASLNGRSNFNQDTPLHIACEKGNFEAIQLLIQKGANINAQNNYKFTPLMYTARQFGNSWSTQSDMPFRLEIIRFLVENGADPRLVSESGDTVLHYLFQSQYPIPIAQTSTIVNLFLTQGLNVNSMNSKGQTPLHVAAENGGTDTVKLLIHFGANANLKDKSLNTPLHVGIEEAWRSKSNPELLNNLLQHGSNANEVNQVGETPLTLVCYKLPFENLTDVDFMKSLVKRGAVVNHLTNDESTPLIRLTKNPNKKYVFEATSFLVKSGANINHVNSAKDTSALSFAYLLNLIGKKINWNVIHYLVLNGVNINLMDDRGYSLLLWAAESGEWDTVRFLINRGADIRQVNMKPYSGNNSTVIHHAVKTRGNLPLIKFLLERGGRSLLYLPGKDGLTPLALASTPKPWIDRDVVEYLNRQG